MAYGGQTPGEFLERVTPRQLHDIFLYDLVEPIGRREQREQLAKLLEMTHNRYRQQGAPALDSDDFKFGVDHEERQASKLLSIAAGMQGVAVARPAGYRRKRPKQVTLQ